MKDLRLTRNQTTYKGKDGKEHNTTEFSIEVNGIKVRVQPVFKNDYKLLSLISEAE